MVDIWKDATISGLDDPDADDVDRESQSAELEGAFGLDVPPNATAAAKLIQTSMQIVNRTAKRNMSGIITIVTAYDKFCKWRKEQAN